MMYKLLSLLFLMRGLLHIRPQPSSQLKYELLPSHSLLFKCNLQPLSEKYRVKRDILWLELLGISSVELLQVELSIPTCIHWDVSTLQIAVPESSLESHLSSQFQCLETP